MLLYQVKFCTLTLKIMHFKQNLKIWQFSEIFCPNEIQGQISWSKPTERVQGILYWIIIYGIIAALSL